MPFMVINITLGIRRNAVDGAAIVKIIAKLGILECFL